MWYFSKTSHLGKNDIILELFIFDKPTKFSWEFWISQAMFKLTHKFKHLIQMSKIQVMLDVDWQ